MIDIDWVAITQSLVILGFSLHWLLSQYNKRYRADYELFKKKAEMLKTLESQHFLDDHAVKLHIRRKKNH